jgi:large subunit ribosomal protein L9
MYRLCHLSLVFVIAHHIMPKRKIENRKISVILLADDKHLGEKYEEVQVAPIFARNVLFPQGIAVPANDMNRHNFATKIAKAEKERAARVASLDEFLAKVELDGGITFVGKVNEHRTLYAKIDEHDIIDRLNETYKTELNINHIKLKNKLAEPGKYDVVYNYRDISKIIPVTIKAENGEVNDETIESSEEHTDIETTEEA